MRLHGRDARLLGEVGRLLDVGDAGRTGGPRHEPDRQRATIEVPDFFARTADHERSGLESVCVQRGAEARPRLPH